MTTHRFKGHLKEILSITFDTTDAECFSSDKAGHIIHWFWKADPDPAYVEASVQDLHALTVMQNIQLFGELFKRDRMKGAHAALANTWSLHDDGRQLLTRLVEPQLKLPTEVFEHLVDISYVVTLGEALQASEHVLR